MAQIQKVQKESEEVSSYLCPSTTRGSLSGNLVISVASILPHIYSICAHLIYLGDCSPLGHKELPHSLYPPPPQNGILIKMHLNLPLK